MLNKSGIAKTTLTSSTQILANVELQASVGCIVPQTLGVEEGAKKIAKAGTPIVVDLTNLQSDVVLADGTHAMNGVLLHDVDVTSAKANGTALIFGFVNLNRIDATTQGKITTALGSNAKSPLLTFVKQ